MIAYSNADFLYRENGKLILISSPVWDFSKSTQCTQVYGNKSSLLSMEERKKLDIPKRDHGDNVITSTTQ